MSKKVFINIAAAIVISSFSAGCVTNDFMSRNAMSKRDVGNILVSKTLSNMNNSGTGGRWTATDFAIARGDINSISKTQITKDMLRKSGMASKSLLNIMNWIK